MSPKKFKELDADNRIWWGEDGNNTPRLKRFLSEVREGRVPQTLWKYKEVGHTQEAKKELLERVSFESSDTVFDTPKPTRLVRQMLLIGSRKAERDIILDFFAGSGSTGDAVMRLNMEDGGNRRFLLVQLPEITGASDYKTIADLTKARCRSASEAMVQELQKRLEFENRAEADFGFRVFKLSSSNLRIWDSAPLERTGQALAEQLELHVAHIREGRTSEDLLFEILLKSGFPLVTNVESMELGGKTVYSIADGAMLACLEDELTFDSIKAMADRKPARVVCLDSGFRGNDQLKTNAVQTMKAKGVTGFKTV